MPREDSPWHAIKRLAQSNAPAAELARSELREFERYMSHGDLAEGLARFASKRRASSAGDART
jgi:enoyl-CoA hydratase/carnithine racemase